MERKETKMAPEPAQVVVINEQQRFSKRCGLFSLFCLLFLPVFIVMMLILGAVVNPGMVIGYSTQSGDQFNALFDFLTVVLILVTIVAGFSAVVSGIVGNRKSNHRVRLGIFLGSIPLALCALIILLILTE